MLPNYLREFFLSRILSGYLSYNKEEISLKLISPTQDILYQASEIYVNIIGDCHKHGVMDEEDVLGLLYENDLWNDEDEKNFMTVLPGHIECFKTDLFNNFFKESERETIRKYLRVAEKEYSNLFNRRNSFNHATVEGIATYAKYQFIVEKCTKTRNNKDYDWEDIGPFEMMNYFQSNVISEVVIREISHTNPWDNIWLAGKKNNRLFTSSAVDLSNEQTRLICWSSMYDSIHESMECPEKDIINDDDALDGWLIIQRQEKDKKQFEKRADSLITNGKIRDAQELYLVAKDVEEAKKIDEMNSSYAKMIKKQRFNVIKERGQVNEGALPDVKNELMQQINRAVSNKIKGIG